jgi:U4/U6 small nuclear ribonucleoprotein PRP31
MATPNDLKRKAMRLLAAKCALAARADAYQEDLSGSVGQGFRDLALKKIEKWQEPPPPKAQKALPKPDDKPRRKRGGRKYRKQKELTRMTELAKQKNRMIFGQAEITDDYTGEGYGMIGVAGSGTLRTQRSKNKQKLVGKAKHQLRRVKDARAGSSTALSGLSSTIALTPVQGMELVNPNAAREREAESAQKYFSNTLGFLQVAKDKTKKELPAVPKFN